MESLTSIISGDRSYPLSLVIAQELENRIGTGAPSSRPLEIRWLGLTRARLEPLLGQVHERRLARAISLDVVLAITKHALSIERERERKRGDMVRKSVPRTPTPPDERTDGKSSSTIARSLLRAAVGKVPTHGNESN